MTRQWPTHSVFELTSYGEVEVGAQVFFELTYRIQETPQYCVVSVTERLGAADTWYGATRGIRAIHSMCEADARRESNTTQALLDTLRVASKRSDYYTKALVANGVVIKATDKVADEAMSVAADLVRWMLRTARQDIVDCMANVGAGVAIIPRDDFVTTLPEFANLRGKSDFTGRTYDSFQIRGLGAVRGQPVTAAAEEHLIGVGTPKDLHITVHEFAHAIQNLCFTASDDTRWSRFYAQALQANLYPGSHAMHDVYEFFAVFSSSYFGVTDELGRRETSRTMIRRDFPDIFAFLQEVYGTPGAPPNDSECPYGVTTTTPDMKECRVQV